jgi:hypothetical protein
MTLGETLPSLVAVESNTISNTTNQDVKQCHKIPSRDYAQALIFDRSL